jgi:hypothetical protein
MQSVYFLSAIELDDLLNRPRTYFNPQTEILIVVDDPPRDGRRDLQHGAQEVGRE